MRYEHIIDLPHHVSAKHKQMSMTSRAAQFSSFKALTGFEDEIDEAARYLDSKTELTDDELEALDKAFQLLSEIGSDQPNISITYFVADNMKKGGKYVTVSGNFRFLDMEVRMLKLTNGTAIPLDDIVDLKFENLST